MLPKRLSKLIREGEHAKVMAHQSLHQLVCRPTNLFRWQSMRHRQARISDSPAKGQPCRRRVDETLPSCKQQAMGVAQHDRQRTGSGR